MSLADNKARIIDSRQFTGKDWKNEDMEFVEYAYYKEEILTVLAGTYLTEDAFHEIIETGHEIAHIIPGQLQRFHKEGDDWHEFRLATVEKTEWDQEGM